MLRLRNHITATTSSSGDKSLVYFPATANRPRRIWVMVTEATSAAPTYPAYVELRLNATLGGTPDSAVVMTKDDPLETATPVSTYQTYSSANTSIDGTAVRRVVVNPRLTRTIVAYDIKAGDAVALWSRANITAAITLDIEFWIQES